MKLLLLVAILGGGFAAPQGLDPDAESVFAPERSPLPQDAGNGTFVIFNPAFFDILRGLFGRGDGFFGSSDPAPPQDSGRFDHPFLNVFRTPFFSGSPFPNGFDEAAGDYDNSTSEVKVVNGSRVEVNNTLTRQSDDNGFFLTHVYTFRRLPEADGEGGQGIDEVPAEISEDVSEEPSRFRHPRWVLMNWLRDALLSSRGQENDIDSHESHLDSFGAPSDRDSYSVEGVGAGGGEPATDDSLRGEEPFIIPIRNHEDLAVNYIEPLPVNPDAEVFDPELLREDRLRFFESRAEPLDSQPIRSQPMVSQPIRSQPMVSQPIRSQPVRL